MKSSQTENGTTYKGFSKTGAASGTQNKNKKNEKKRRQKTPTQKSEVKIIKERGNRYEDLKEIEALLRIHAQANSPHREIYRALFTISRKERRYSEALKWAKKWITYPPINIEEAMMQARIANRLKDLDSLKRITKFILNLNQEKATVPMQWCIKQLLIAEEWEEAYKTIRRLKKIKPDLEAIKPLEAMCIYETQKITQKEKVTRIKQLELGKITRNDRQITIIKQRALYEQGEDPIQLISTIEAQKVNRNGTGIERLLVPILMAANQTQQAIEICTKILSSNQSAQKLRQIYGECLLRQGKWRHGFTEKTANQKERTIISNKDNINIYCNGTLGETLFFSRWLSYINKTTPKTTVYAQQPLLKILKYNFKCIHFTSLKNNHYHHKQEHLPLAQLPLCLKDWEKSKDIFEFKLKTEESIVSQWKELLNKENGQKLIAINWHGSALKSTSEVSTSDINLEYFSCLTKTKNIKLISLQKGTGTKELDNCSFKSHFHEQQERISNENRLEHIAGIIANCDAVICDDSGPAHLASNLGTRTIINARTHCSWIWQQNHQLENRFYPKTETSYFTINWVETILAGWQKLNKS